MKSVLTVDLGGTKTRFARITEDLRTLDDRAFPTPRSHDELVDLLTTRLGELNANRHRDVEPPVAIGVAAAGIIGGRGRIVDAAPNLLFEPAYGLADALEAKLGLPTTLINDGRASAVGEYAHGYGKGRDPLLALFFGTGIGVGLIVDGEPFEGTTNAAGEVGHTPHRYGGRTCACGRSGCFEAYCGGGPIAQRAAEELGEPPPGRDHWSIADIVARAAEEPVCRAILDDAERAATALVASCCTLLNPAAVVLGGGLFKGWPELRGIIERFCDEWCSEAVRRGVRFYESRGDADAILWGAAQATRALW